MGNYIIKIIKSTTVIKKIKRQPFKLEFKKSNFLINKIFKVVSSLCIWDNVLNCFLVDKDEFKDNI